MYVNDLHTRAVQNTQTLSHCRYKSPTGGVYVFNLLPYIHVAKYTLCDIFYIHKTMCTAHTISPKISGPTVFLFGF